MVLFWFAVFFLGGAVSSITCVCVRVRVGVSVSVSVSVGVSVGVPPNVNIRTATRNRQYLALGFWYERTMAYAGNPPWHHTMSLGFWRVNGDYRLAS